MLSPLFYHPLIYRYFTKLYYKKHYKERYSKISEIIADGAVVNDICCGDAYLYEQLKEKNVQYHAYDINQTYVSWLRKKGIDASVFDLTLDELPKGDYLILQSSLYQFIPDHESILKKLINSSHKYVILSEVHNSRTIESNNRIMQTLARWSSTTAKGPCSERFDYDQLMDLFTRFKASKVFTVDRDLVGIFESEELRGDS